MGEAGQGFELQEFTDAAGFLQEAEELLRADEAAHSLMYGLALAAKGRAAPVRGWLVRQRGRAILPLFQTPPLNVILGSAPDLAPVAFAANAMASRAPALEFFGAVGPVHETAIWSETWTSATGQAFRSPPGMRQRLYKATEVLFAPPTAGRRIQATTAHLETVAGFLHAFALESVPHEAGTLDEARTAALRRIEAGQVHLWESEGRVVAQAALGRPTPHGITVNAVYTPPGERGRGHATGLVAELTRGQLEAGRKFCVLYTDLSNPTSNSIYQKIGYRAHADSIHLLRDQEPVNRRR